MGLVQRKTVKNKVLNSLTSDGKKIVTLAEEIADPYIQCIVILVNRAGLRQW
jgi:hypothetical protein